MTGSTVPSIPSQLSFHVEQTGLHAVITGVVIDGWGKGNLVTGEYDEVKCDHDGVTTDCWRGTLDDSASSRPRRGGTG